MENDRRLTAFAKLLDIMDELREKCPWDAKQTFESLRSNTIEETYELADAVLKKDMNGIRKELGDLLLHIVFYAKIGNENNAFDITDVINGICNKLVYRHPHVFGSVDVHNSADEVVKNWEQLKLKEKDGNTSVLSGVPDALPALVKAGRIQEKASAVGFDWENRSQVWQKVMEEYNEVQDEITNCSEHLEEEFGDLFFAVVNAARLYDIDPETALERTNKKFIRRFEYLEQHTIKQGRPLKTMTLDEMNEIWEAAKRLEPN